MLDVIVEALQDIAARRALEVGGLVGVDGGFEVLLVVWEWV